MPLSFCKKGLLSLLCERERISPTPLDWGSFYSEVQLLSFHQNTWAGVA